MEKQESLILKGVAILFMLYLHLFNQESCVIIDCNNTINIFGHPLAFILSRAASPVPLYLILSGYGLTISSNNGGNSLMNRMMKICKLLLYYWTVMSIFITIGHYFIDSNKYPGSLHVLWENYSTLWQTYNLSYWFLCPYLILMLLSPYIFAVFSRIRCRYILLVSLLIDFATSYYISRIGYGDWIEYRLLYNAFLALHCIFPFSIGYVLARTNLLAIEKRKLRPHMALLMIVTLVAFRCTMQTSLLHTFYTTLFLYLFLQLNRPIWFDRLLMFLGKENLGMWMTHLWFSYIFFHEWIYWPKYPVFVFLLFVAVSYCSAKVFSTLLTPFYCLINKYLYVKSSRLQPY